MTPTEQLRHSVAIRNQFGGDELATTKSDLLCVPSLKTLVPPTPTPTATPCASTAGVLHANADGYALPSQRLHADSEPLHLDTQHLHPHADRYATMPRGHQYLHANADSVQRGGEHVLADAHANAGMHLRIAPRRPRQRRRALPPSARRRLLQHALRARHPVASRITGRSGDNRAQVRGDASGSRGLKPRLPTFSVRRGRRQRGRASRGCRRGAPGRRRRTGAPGRAR